MLDVWICLAARFPHCSLILLLHLLPLPPTSDPAGKSHWEPCWGASLKVSLGSLVGKSCWEVSLLGVRGALSGVGWRGKLEARGRTFLWVAWQGRVRNPTRNHQEASTCPRTRLQIQFGRQGITCSREHTLEDKLVHRGLAQLVKG